MYSSVSMEAEFFLASLVAGIGAAFLYDLLRISRRVSGPCDAVVNLGDVAFFAVLAVIVFFTAFVKNGGEIRWQGFLGCGAGAGIYALVVRNRFLNVSTFLIKWLVRIAERILKILFFPLGLVLKIFRRPVRLVMWYTGCGIRRARSVARRNGDRLWVRFENVKRILRKK